MIVRPFLFQKAGRQIIRSVSISLEQIELFASEIGIDRVGAATAQRLDDEEVRLRQWLGHQYQGQMAWIEREPEKRADPSLIFDEARSVVVCLVNYFTDHDHAALADHGKISRYAWGDDYHDIVREKLKMLLAKIKEIDPQADGKICVDTVPFMDKAWAVRAGLGWIGKHSNVISREVGSWTFIGSIILNIDVTGRREIVDDHCGTCTACIDACPTSAITAPYIVDAQKCISYTTIELRDERLSDKVAEGLDGWAYGCDVCQDVCPWNRFKKPTDDPRFQPRNNETSLFLPKIVEMEYDEYVERFRRSPMKRAKLSGLKRNAEALMSRKDG